MQSRPASMTTRDKLDPSLTGRIRISTVICYASMRIPAPEPATTAITGHGPHALVNEAEVVYHPSHHRQRSHAWHSLRSSGPWYYPFVDVVGELFSMAQNG
jgi:hypothetical protein